MADWFWYFLFYSFLGFLLEVLFAKVTRSPHQARKCFLFLPLCPVYGLGALLILLLPPAVCSHPALLFPAAALLSTAAEYAMALFYQQAAGVRFWDYSALPLHIKGRVCLLFSLFWGLLAFPLCHWIHPRVAPALSALPRELVPPAALFLLLDGGLTLYLLRREREVGVLCWYRRLLPRRLER